MPRYGRWLVVMAAWGMAAAWSQEHTPQIHYDSNSNSNQNHPLLVAAGQSC
jgi:hypothetical protein